MDLKLLHPSRLAARLTEIINSINNPDVHLLWYDSKTECKKIEMVSNPNAVNTIARILMKVSVQGSLLVHRT